MGGRGNLIADIKFQKIKKSIEIIFRFTSQEIGITEIKNLIQKFQKRQL